MIIKCNPGRKRLLHVGCGTMTKHNLEPVFHYEDWDGYDRVIGLAQWESNP